QVRESLSDEVLNVFHPLYKAVQIDVALGIPDSSLDVGLCEDPTHVFLTTLNLDRQNKPDIVIRVLQEHSEGMNELHLGIGIGDPSYRFRFIYQEYDSL